MTHAALLRRSLVLLWLAILFAPAAAMAQAQPAPIPPSPGSPDIFTQGATMPDVGGSGAIGSAVAPDWSQSAGQNGLWLPACAGITCLSPAQRQEINALCSKAGTDWTQYTLCQEMSARISQGLGP